MSFFLQVSFNREKEFLGKVYSNNEYFFVSVEGEITDIDQLRNIVIEPSKHVKLSDVAVLKKVGETSDVRYRVNGKSTLGMTIIKDSQSNLLNVSNELKKRIEELNNDLRDENLELIVKFNQASILEDALGEIKKLAFYGILLAFFVLLLFLRDIRIVSIIIVAIPISVIFTFNIMYFSGITLNILSFCGLALAIGMLVDNSIVVIENIFRHYKEKASPFDASLYGASEVTKAISASTFTTIAVFLPTIFVQNELRIILKEFALSIINPLVVSLLVSFTLIPMFSYQVLKRKKTSADFLTERGKSGSVFYRYLFLLVTGLRNRGKFLFGLAALFIITLVATLPFVLTMEQEERNYQFSIYVDTPMENTIDATDRLVSNIEKELEELEYLNEIRSIIRENDAVISVEFEEEMVYKDKVNIESVKTDLKKKTDIMSGGIISYDRNVGVGGRGGSGGGGGDDSGIGGFLGMTPSKEQIKVRGHDLEKLRSLAEEIRNSLEKAEETENVEIDFRKESPEIRLIGKHDRMAFYNLTMFDIMRLMWVTRQEGISSSTEFKYRDYSIPIKIFLNEKEDRKLYHLDFLGIPVEGVGNVPLKYLTDKQITDGAKIIKRRNQQREIEIAYDIKAELKEYKPILEDTRRSLDDLVHKIYLPKGFTIEIEHDTSKNTTLYWMLGISAILIFMILASVFESLVTPFIIFVTIPLATIGVFWLLLITGTGLNQMALLGMLILLGIIVNNGIILIDYANHLRREQGFGKLRAITYAGIVRLRPIFMTAGTTVLGILPLAFKTNKPDQIWPPFAIAVLGGLGFGTLFTTVIIPVMYMTSEEIVENFKKIKPKLLPLLFGFYIGAFLITDYWVNSLLWKILIIFMLFIFTSWIVMKINDMIYGKSREFLKLKEFSINLKSLTKIYNQPSQIVRTWRKFNKYRKQEFEEDARKDKSKTLRNDLLWQVPLALFFIYLHTYFSKPVWLFILTICTYFYLKFLFSKLREIFKLDFAFFIRFRKLRKILYFLLVVLIFMYLKARWGSGMVLPVLGIISWFMIRHFRFVSKNIETFRTTLAKKKRFVRVFYTLIFKIPFFRPVKPEVTALKHVNLKIEKGMFGLLGPNGAGKTTLMRLVCNIIDESYGSIFIGDINVKEIRESIQKRIGYLPQSFGLYDNFTAYQYLNLIAILNGIWNYNKREYIIDNVLNSVGLIERKNDKIKSFSGGMKQRLGIAKTLLHIPDILVVDEPTAGLDPKERIRFRNLLSEMGKEKIVIFSTHVVEDISSSCNKLAVLNKGEVVFEGKPYDLIRNFDGKIWSTELSENGINDLKKDAKVLSFNKMGDKYKVKYYAESVLDKYNPVPENPTLEDAYLSLIG
ncbi:efflux RND transporter permease subunit [candidate division KSB1 bacterium]